MIIKHFFTPGLAINSYLIFDEEEKRGAVIDPTREIEVYLAYAMQEGVEITDIFETHVHADFVSGALELKRALVDSSKLNYSSKQHQDNIPQIHCSGMGGKEWIPSYADHVVNDRDVISLGSIKLQAWHTPGHTPEHVIWVVFNEKRSSSVPEIVFTGDLIFVGSVGRPDLLGPKAEEVLAKQLYETLFKSLHSLPDFVEIYPAHGAGSLCGKAIGSNLSSTFGYEKKSNPGLIPQPYDQWFKELHENMPPVPAYFKQMKKVNVTGPNLTDHEEMPLVLTNEQVKNHLTSSVFVDIRRPEQFAAGHIRGAINIPLTPSFVQWAGIALPVEQQLRDCPKLNCTVGLGQSPGVDLDNMGQFPIDQPRELSPSPTVQVNFAQSLIIVTDTPSVIVYVVNALKLIGFDDILGFADITHVSSDLLMASPMFEASTLLSNKENYYILDVRTQKEWDKGHIPGAHHLELTKAPQALGSVPKGKPIVVICHSGNRASIVASLLEKEGREGVYNLKNGIKDLIH